jgi:hypothetical protein
MAKGSRQAKREHRWLVGDPTLLPGESVAWCKGLARVGKRSTHGGVLYISDKRVLFLPNRFERFFGSATWDCYLSEIARVERVPSGINPLTGSLGGKFTIVTKAAERVTFASYSADEPVRLLESVIG